MSKLVIGRAAAIGAAASLPAHGQTLSVKGTVVDAVSGSPVAGASVSARSLDSSIVTTTDSRGEFVVHINSSIPATLAFRRLGFAPRELTILPDTVIGSIRVALQPAAQELGAVTTSSTSTLIKGCTLIFVDGIAMLALRDVQPADVIGIEIYESNTEAPARFRNPRDGAARCGSIVVWRNNG